MHRKRYCRENVKDARQAVRDELGPDVLVLSTQAVPATGVRGLLGQQDVEATAAAERQMVPDERHIVDAGGVGPTHFEAAQAAGRVRGRQPRPSVVNSLRDTVAKEVTLLAATGDSFVSIDVFVGPPGVGKTMTSAKIAAARRGSILAHWITGEMTAGAAA